MEIRKSFMKKLFAGFVSLLFIFMIFSEASNLGVNTQRVEGNYLGITQEEPTLFLKVAALEELDFADEITFGITAVRGDKLEQVQLAYINAELRPRGADIVLARAKLSDFTIHDTYLYISSFPPLNAAGEYEIYVEASWYTAWETYVNSSAVAYFHIDSWRGISEAGEDFLEELDRKANEIIYGINLLETGGDDILSIMTTRIACVEILQKALLVWGSLPSKFDFTIINLDGYNNLGVTTDRNTTQLELDFNNSVGKVSELGVGYTVRYIRNITQLEWLFTATSNFSLATYQSIVYNLHGGYLPIPENMTSIAKYPFWIDMLRNSTQSNRWIWVNLGRGTPLRYISWFNSTSSSYSFRPIDNVQLLTYFYEVYQAPFEENYVPDFQKNFHFGRYKYIQADVYGGNGNGEGWKTEFGFNNREAEYGYAGESALALVAQDAHSETNVQQLVRVGDFQLLLGFPQTEGTTTDRWEFESESPTYTFNDIAYAKDFSINYRSYDIFNFRPENAGASQAQIDAERSTIIGDIIQNRYPQASQGLDFNSTITVRYRISDDFNTLTNMSWTEVVVPDGWVNYTQFVNGDPNTVSYWLPNHHGYSDQINYSNSYGAANGANDLMLSAIPQGQSEGIIDYGYPYLPWYSGSDGGTFGDYFTPLRYMTHTITLPIDQYSGTGKFHLQVNVSVHFDFDPELNLDSTLAMTEQGHNNNLMKVEELTPVLNWVSFDFDRSAPSDFSFIDEVPETLPLNFTITEGSYASNGTTSFKSELVDYTQDLLNVILPNTIDTSGGWHLPSTYDAKKFYFTFNGEIALGMRVATGNVFVHSIVDARTTTLCTIGGIWKAYEEAVIDTIDDLTKIYYATQYEFPFIANESVNVKWALIDAWNDRNLTKVKDSLKDAVFLANDTFRRYDDPLAQTFDFTIQIGQINISQSLDALADQAENTQEEITRQAQEASAEINRTLEQVRLADNVVSGIQLVFGILAAAFFVAAGVALAGGLGFLTVGTAIAFGIMGATSLIAIGKLEELKGVLVEWETNIINTVKAVVTQAIMTVVGEVNRAIATSVQMISDIVLDLEYRINVVIQDINSKLNEFADQVRTAITAVLELIVRVRSDVLGFIKESLRLIKDFFKVVFTELLQGVSDLSDVLGTAEAEIKQAATWLPQLGGSIVRTITDSARNSEFVRYILDTLGITDQAFELAESVANSISNSRMADVGLGIVIANPFLEQDTPSTVYLMALSYGSLHDLTSLEIIITNSETFFYEYPTNITRVSTGVYKISATIPEGQYTVASEFTGSEEAFATDRISVGREFFLADLGLAVSLEADREVYQSGDTIDLKIWTTNRMYSYNYVNVEIRLIDANTKFVALREDKLSLFIDVEETKVTTVNFELPWYLLPANYILEVIITEPNGETAVATYSVRVEWGFFQWVGFWSPALMVNGFPLALIFWGLIIFYTGKWGASKGIEKIRKPNKREQQTIQRRRK